MLRHISIMRLFTPLLLASGLIGLFGVYAAMAEPADTTQDVAFDIADSGDSWDGASEACGSISHEGCCAQNQIFFCQNNEVKNIDCSNLQGVFTWCGWRSADGIYDCGTSGMAAPENDPPFLCENQICEANCEARECGPDGCGASCGSCAPGQVCATDDGVCQEMHSCGDIGSAGCCDGDTLRFCGGSSASPKLQEKDCAAMELSCGWSKDGAWYDCGLEAREDPGGVFARECPPLLPSCVPDCSDKTCGDDGCWGSCGQCAVDEICDEDQRCSALPGPDVSDTQRFHVSDEGLSNQSRADIPTASDKGGDDPQTPPKKIVRSSCNAATTPGSPYTPIFSLICLAFALAIKRATFQG